jgi:tetratricopeptide (TPR) repeat protein
MAKLNLAAELRRQRDYQASLKLAREAAALDPKSALAFSMAAEAAYFVGDFASSEQYYLRALVLEPAQPDQLYYLGMGQIRSGHYEAGLDTIRKGLSLWPTAPGYRYALGLGLSGTGDWEGAQDAFRQELSFNPNHAGASAALAEANAHLQNVAARKSSQ